jgi:hypothetical protein
MNEEDFEKVCRVVHESHVAYCETYGDYSHKHWDEASIEERQPTIDIVNLASGREKTDDGLCESPQDIHMLWVRRKVRNGWKFGPTKDETKKHHPHIVDWDFLIMSERVKNYLAWSVIKAVM